MAYGVYLAGELMEEHNDYFEACRDAQQLTRDTGVVHWAMSIEENKIAKENFNIEDIDGCEFVKSKTLGNMLISFDQDMDDFYTGVIYVVYADGSGITISSEEAQRLIDSKEWTVFQM
ncbi:hypothetical protein QUF83_02460 [Bacillus cereus]|uniref:hypothetical protein n=1 Tax=Bacillus cereus TaxID=1396 RepID=UPI0025A24065|nr:hypothetical protein [Bacillus cereus]MDM5235109.1 hypothetical protein [Bacillus cereus]